MKVQFQGMCRGDGRAYAKVTIPDVPDGHALRVSARSLQGFDIPCTIYPSSRADEYIIMSPLLASDRQTLIIDDLDERGLPVSSFTKRINAHALAWESRFNYRFRPELTSEISGIEYDFKAEQIISRIDWISVDEDHAIFRVRFTIPSHKESDIDIHMFDGVGKLLSYELLHVEDYIVEGEGPGELAYRQIVVSARLPRGLKDFYFLATDRHKLVRNGFVGVVGPLYDEYLKKYIDLATDAAHDLAYDSWFRRHRATQATIALQRTTHFEKEPFIDIIITGQKDHAAFMKTIASIEMQSYTKWNIIEGSNTAADVLTEVIGEYLAFVTAGDTLESDALFNYVKAINSEPDVRLLYCDEDTIDALGIYKKATFKPCFSPDLLTSYNYIDHMLMLSRKTLDEVAAIGPLNEDAWKYDLVLRATDATGSAYHIPKVLYHCMERPVNLAPYQPAATSEMTVLDEHFARIGISAKSHPMLGYPTYRQEYVLTEHPKVSILIPSRDSLHRLDACIKSIVEKSTYDNFEIVVIENGSVNKGTREYYEQMVKASSRVHLIEYEGEFNFSKIVNFGASKTEGDYILLLNNDTEVIAPGFIEAMVGHCLREDVGVVGAKLCYRDDTIQHAGMRVGPGGDGWFLDRYMSRDIPGYGYRIM